ncbi:tripartite tricarboxylate transporter TctB family protein [Oceanobacillus sp. FSL K6-2867]|uniref:tripartite tricarboxylate transporter TctB family protein n=1 Tax=Oceanobacillus sp. FSL K6-2867 TaxID=2954748 RepID=UPI0030DD442F
MRAANLMFSIAIIGICGFLFSETYQFTTMFAQDGIGPAFFPRVILALIIITQLFELVKSFRLENSPMVPKSMWPNSIRLVIFIAVVILFISLLGVVPFIINASISLFLLCLILRLPFFPSVLASVGLSVVVYIIFKEGFNIMI